MVEARQRQPAVNQPPHPVPQDAAILAASRQRAIPVPPNVESEDMQCRLVHGYNLVTHAPPYHHLQPFALVRDGLIDAPVQLGFHLVELRLQSASSTCRRTRGATAQPKELALRPSRAAGIPQENSDAAEYPAHTLCFNASTPPLRATRHNSGPMWVANPLSYDFFIHYKLAAFAGAQERYS